MKKGREGGRIEEESEEERDEGGKTDEGRI